MVELWFRLALQLSDDGLGERLPKLNTPLIEGIDAPDGALTEDAVFI